MARPMTFESKPDSPTILMVLKRDRSKP